MEYSGSEYLLRAAANAEGLQNTISVISRVLNILVFITNVTVILVMFVKCSKFRRTRRYDDYNGIKTLSKALEVIVIFLVIDAVYGLTRIFPIIDTMNLINSVIPDFPQEVFAYLIFITVALPIIGCVISFFAWSYYHKTRRLFFSVYPNGVQQVDLRPAAYVPDDSIFGSSSVANLNYSANGAKKAAPSPGGTGAGLADMGAQGFYAKASAVNSQSTGNVNNTGYTANPANGINNRNGINGASGTNARFPGQNAAYPGYTANAPGRINPPAPVPQPAAQNTDDIFGAGVSDDYINRLTVTDQARLEQVLVQDTPDTEYKVTPAQNDEGDIFGTGSSLWEAVPDMSDPLISEILVNEEEPKAEVYESGQDSLFGSGTTEDYMKRFTTADDDLLSGLLVQDETKEQ